MRRGRPGEASAAVERQQDARQPDRRHGPPVGQLARQLAPDGAGRHVERRQPLARGEHQGRAAPRLPRRPPRTGGSYAARATPTAQASDSTAVSSSMSAEPANTCSATQTPSVSAVRRHGRLTSRAPRHDPGHPRRAGEVVPAGPSDTNGPESIQAPPTTSDAVRRRPEARARRVKPAPENARSPIAKTLYAAHGSHETPSQVVGYRSFGASLSGLIKLAGGGLRLFPSHLDLSKVDTQFGKGQRAQPPQLRHPQGEPQHRPADSDYVVRCREYPEQRFCGRPGAGADFRRLPRHQGGLADGADTQGARAGPQEADRASLCPDPLRCAAPDVVGHRPAAERASFGSEVCEARIAESVSVAESPSHNRSVFGHAPRQPRCPEHTALLDELQAAISCGSCRRLSAVSQSG